MLRHLFTSWPLGLSTDGRKLTGGTGPTVQTQNIDWMEEAGPDHGEVKGQGRYRIWRIVENTGDRGQVESRTGIRNQLAEDLYDVLVARQKWTKNPRNTALSGVCIPAATRRDKLGSGSLRRMTSYRSARTSATRNFQVVEDDRLS